MLTIKDLSFSYKSRKPLIEDFSMTLEHGCVAGLLGPNGSGKSTLIYLICGLLKPQNGSIDFNGYTPINRKTGFLEDVFLLPEEFTLPAVELSDFIRVNAPFYPKFDYAAMQNYLSIFELTADVNLGTLSMGQKKKVFISFAMACNTSLLILDEPTNGLDITAKRNFRRAVTACMDDNKIILISTHQVYDIDKVLDHVIIINRNGMLMNAQMQEVSSTYKFSFTSDRDRAAMAIIALPVPGGYNIAEYLDNPQEETEVNLETLYELVTQQNHNFKMQEQ